MEKAPIFFAVAHRWRFLLAPHNLFLLLAIPLHYFFFLHVFPLQVSVYGHGNERFLHSVSATYELLHAEPDKIPAAYLVFAYRASADRFRYKFHSQIPLWRRQMHNPHFIASGAPCTQIPPRKHAALMQCLEHTGYPAPSQVVPFHSIFRSGEYSMLGYLPYMAGMAVGLVLHLAPPATYALSQLSDLAIMLALAYATLRLAPVLAWPLMFLLLMPSMFAMRVFYMPDGPVIELGFLLLALILHLRQRGQKLDLRMQLLLALLAISVAVAKIVYFLLPLLLLLLPAALFRGNRHRWCFVLLVSAFGLLLTGWWNMHAATEYYPVNWHSVWNSALPMPAQHKGTRVNEMYLRMLLHQPFQVLELLLGQWFTLTGLGLTLANAGFWNRVIDPSLGSMARTPALLYFWFLGVLLLSALEAGAVRRVLALKRWEYGVVSGVLLSTIALISLMLFAFWGGAVVYGAWLIPMLQGRYFIPVFPFFLLLLPALRILKENALGAPVRGGICIVLVAMTLYLNYLYQLYF